MGRLRVTTESQARRTCKCASSNVDQIPVECIKAILGKPVFSTQFLDFK